MEIETMKNKNIQFNIGKGQLQKIKNFCIFVEETARVIYDDQLNNDLKVESIKMFLERYCKG